MNSLRISCNLVIYRILGRNLNESLKLIGIRSQCNGVVRRQQVFPLFGLLWDGRGLLVDGFSDWGHRLLLWQLLGRWLLRFDRLGALAGVRERRLLINSWHRFNRRNFPLISFRSVRWLLLSGWRRCQRLGSSIWLLFRVKLILNDFLFVERRFMYGLFLRSLNGLFSWWIHLWWDRLIFFQRLISSVIGLVLFS